MKDTTIIIPNRDGKNINIVIKRLKELYRNSKILVISQVDDRPFCRGQLFNIAIQKVSTKYVMFLDNDILLEEYVDLEKIYEKNNCKVIQPFFQISQVYIDQDNQVHKLYTDQRNFAHFNDTYNIDRGVSCGGCVFMSVENFKKVNGFSNLYIGWGQEDNEFYLRCNREFISLSLTIDHIRHERRVNKKNINLSILNRYNYFDKTKDGYNDTTYKLKEIRVTDDVTHVDVYNVYVKDDFLYKNILDEQYRRYGGAMKKLVSIIIPCYNINIDYFNRCLESIKTQSIGFENLEIIIVDDNSKTNSLYLEDYCKTHQLKYLRTNKNKGPGGARNLGLDNVSTNYVMFLDYDDFYIDDSTIENMYNKIHNTNNEVVFSTFINKNRPVMYTISNKEDLLKYSPAIFTKIFSKKFLDSKEIRFTDFKNSQDSIFMLDVISNLEHYTIYDQPIIYYEIHESSISNDFSIESFLTRLRAKVYFDSLALSYGIENLGDIMFSMGWIIKNIFSRVRISSDSKHLEEIYSLLQQICEMENLDFDIVKSYLNITNF